MTTTVKKYHKSTKCLTLSDFQSPQLAITELNLLNLEDHQREEKLTASSPNKCTARNGAVATSTTTTDFKSVPQTEESSISTTLSKAAPFSNVSTPLFSSITYNSVQNDKTMATAAAALGSGCTPSLSTHLISGVKVSNIGVIDCSMNSTSSVTLNNSSIALNDKDINSTKIEKLLGNKSGGSSNNDVESYHSTGSSGNIGGRLKFFKNGKVILELARSKEGSKSRWISVPRKVFRTPSATSSTVTPTLATSIACNKNESLASLSFSDDNSSIQSSPWQREHCWKQQSPRNGISNAMSFYYQRPKYVILTKVAYVIARRKRRRPHDTNVCPGNFIFESNKQMLEENQSAKILGTPTLLKQFHQHDLRKVNVKQDSDIKCKTRNNELNFGLINEEDGCSSSSTATLTGYDCIDDRMGAKTPTPSSNSSPHSPCHDKPFENKDPKEKQASATKDNTFTDLEHTDKVEHADLISTIEENERPGPTLNGNESEVSNVNTQSVKVYFKDEHDQRSDDKRFKNAKIRHKLNTIVQKLIDRMPLRLAQLSKLKQSVGPTNSFCGSTNPPSQKVSPSNASTTTRLVEYPQHHVSPRKRILREFEKVSLEDNSNLAGGKRSRAKSNASSSSTSPHHSIKSPNSRNNINASSNINQSVSCGNSSIRSSSTTYSKSETTESINTTAPTRLYSSYSIHSLLGGNVCSSTIPSGPNKITNETLGISSKGYHTQHQHVSLQTNYSDPSYLRAMLASPNSPEQCNMGCGGKSPSTSASKKRSPPYVSPSHDIHINSDVGTLNNKTRCPSEQTNSVDTTSTILSGSHSHLHSQNKGFYVPYIPLSKYVPQTSTSVSTESTSSISPSSSGTLDARSPRHLSAFSRTSSPASISSGILANQSTSSIGNSRENSPPTSRATSDSPRDNIPRTVPKKTASIRRQFASPNVVALSIGSSSSGERHSEDIYSIQDHQTPVPLVNTCSSGNHQLLRGSPNNTVPSPLHPYYMYSPVASNDSSNQVPRSSPVSTSTFSVGPGGTNNSAAPAVAAASYIPSVLPTAYMNPYFALAALRQPQLWTHYGGLSLPLHLSSVAASASLRLSPPAFHTFAYSGVNAAMAAVVQQQQQQQQVLASSALMHAHNQTSASAVPNNHQAINACGIRQVSAGTMTERTTELDASFIANNTTGIELVTEEVSISKKEHSTDVPLNLSKH